MKTNSILKVNQKLTMKNQIIHNNKMIERHRDGIEVLNDKNDKLREQIRLLDR